MRQAVLSLVALIVLLPIVSAEATIGWVYSGSTEPSSRDGLQTREFRILSGLQYWHTEAFQKRKGSALLTVAPANGDYDLAYSSLCLQGATYLIGPASWQATFEVIAGNATRTNCKSSTSLFGFLIMDQQLEAIANAAGFNWFSLNPRIPLNDPFSIPVLKNLLFEQDQFTWSILTTEINNNDPELDLISSLGLAIATNLTQPQPSNNITYTLFSSATFESGNASSFVVPEFIRAMAQKRPEVNALALGVATDDSNFTYFLNNQLYPSLELYKPNPDTILLLAPVEFYDLLKEEMKRIKYWTALAFWDHRYRYKTDSDKSKSLGSSQDYWNSFKQRNGRYPGNWDAIASATALVLDHADMNGGALNATKFNSFWQPIDFTKIDSQPELRQVPATNWQTVQFISGDTVSIGATTKTADRKSVSSPGRWKWRSYSLDGSAIAAIILAVILMLLGLIVAIIATCKFIALWRNPPSHSAEEGDEDEKEKSD